MAVYLISYDLNKSGKNYDGVYEAIKNASTGVWCHPLDSTWVIKSNLNIKDISNRIQAKTDNDDRFIVIEVTKNAWGILRKKDWKYIEQNIFT